MRTRNKAKEEAREESAKPEDDPRDGFRTLCTGLLFWTACVKACRRAKACAGDSRACFERRWPIVPEGIRFRLRVFIKTWTEGVTKAEAWAKAEAEAERWAEDIARIDAETDAWLRAQREARAAATLEATPCASPAAEANAAQPSRRERGPRMRVL